MKGWRQTWLPLLGAATLIGGCGDAGLSPVDYSPAVTTGSVILPLTPESIVWLERPLPGDPGRWIRVALSESFSWELPPGFIPDPADSLRLSAEAEGDRLFSDDMRWQLELLPGKSTASPSGDFVLLTQRDAALAGAEARYLRYANPTTGDIVTVWASPALTVRATLSAPRGVTASEQTNALLEHIRATVKSISLRNAPTQDAAVSTLIEDFYVKREESRAPITLTADPPHGETSFLIELPASWTDHSREEGRIEFFHETSAGRQLVIELRLGQRSLGGARTPADRVREILRSAYTDGALLNAEPVYLGEFKGIRMQQSGVVEVDEAPVSFLRERREANHSNWTFEMKATLFAEAEDDGMEKEFSEYKALFAAIAGTFRLVEER